MDTDTKANRSGIKFKGEKNNGSEFNEFQQSI